MDRIERTSQKVEELFHQSAAGADGSDGEFMQILQRYIFGELCYTGSLDNRMRELVTITVLTAIQALPQLKAHLNACLNVGCTPVELREAIYQCAPFIGFPRTLNAIGTFNEVMNERGIKLPLEEAGTITEENRHDKGAEIQNLLYGDEVKRAMKTLPGEYKNAVPDILTDFCFGDFYTRKGLTLKQQELLSFVTLTALGAEKQLKAHVIGNIKAGNDKETLLAAMVQTIPYIGLPNALTAINLIKETEVDNYKPIYE